jgi:hypothetical protein
MLLMDSDLARYLLGEDLIDTELPELPDLWVEYAELMAPLASPARIMAQETRFRMIQDKNRAMETQLSLEEIEKVHGKAEPAGMEFMCFCHRPVPQDLETRKDVVECGHRDCPFGYFHRFCVRDLVPELSTRWYCTLCELKMKMAAWKLLGVKGGCWKHCHV